MSLMPSFRIHRLKENAYQQFRWAPHLAGTSEVKHRDYTEGEPIEAPSAYAAWDLLRSSGQPLRVGDLLEDPSGALRICKYVGFEEARWAIPVEQQPAVPAASEAPEPSKPLG